MKFTADNVQSKTSGHNKFFGSIGPIQFGTNAQLLIVYSRVFSFDKG